MLGEKTAPEYEFDYLDIGCVGTGELKAKPERVKFRDAPSGARQVVKKGDTIISTVRTYLKSVYFIKDEWPDLIASIGFAVLRPVDALEPELLGYSLQSNTFIDRVNRSSTGAIYPQISESRLKALKVAFPSSVEEQRHILRFLRQKDTQVRSLISNKQELIDLLNERKQVIINRAITRGLNSEPHMKSSGIDWMPEVPIYWKIKRLKIVAQNITEYTNLARKGNIYIALEHVRSWTGDIISSGENAPPESQLKSFIAGDVLFGKLRPYLAKVTRPKQLGVCVGEFLVLRPKEDSIRGDFLELLLRSKQFIDIVNSSTFGAKMPRAEWSFIGSIKIAFPPSLNEQEQIVKSLTFECGIIDREIKRTENEISLITEFRERLISDVVTGKLDIRYVNMPEHGEFSNHKEKNIRIIGKTTKVSEKNYANH